MSSKTPRKRWDLLGSYTGYRDSGMRGAESNRYPNALAGTPMMKWPGE